MVLGGYTASLICQNSALSRPYLRPAVWRQRNRLGILTEMETQSPYQRWPVVIHLMGIFSIARQGEQGCLI